MDLEKYLNSEDGSQGGETHQLSKEEYAALKKQEREEVWAEIDAKAQDVFKDSDSLKGFLNFVAQCAPQRTPNLLLLYSQNPEIRQVKTYEKSGRKSIPSGRRPGAKCISLWQGRNMKRMAVPCRGILSAGLMTSARSA